MPESDRSIKAAGGVLSRPTEDGREYLLVHRARYDDWTLPKGKVKRGESLSQAALREVKEETGYAVTLRDYLGEIRYEVDGVPKVVHMWNMDPAGPPDPVLDRGEVDSVVWLRAAEALERLVYPLEREILAKALQLGAAKS